MQQALSGAVSAMKRLVIAYEEDLVSLDELRQRMPELRRREKMLTGEIESLDSHLANEEIYLKLAENLEPFLVRLRNAATNSSVSERQQVLRLVVREVVVDTDTVVIRHTIPGLDPGGQPTCHLRGWSACGDSPAGHHPEDSRLLGPAVPGAPRASSCFRIQ